MSLSAIVLHSTTCSARSRGNVYPIYIPALGERTADIPILVKAILNRIAPDENYSLTASALNVLSEYEFRGNIRELRNLLNRAIVLADISVIDHAVMTACMKGDPRTGAGTEVLPLSDHYSITSQPALTRWEKLKDNECNYLTSVLDAHDGNREKAAKVLGISVRSLYRKIQNCS